MKNLVLTVMLFGLLAACPVRASDLCSTTEGRRLWVLIYSQFSAVEGKNTHRVKVATDRAMERIVSDDQVITARQFLVSGTLKMRYTTKSNEVTTAYRSGATAGTGTLKYGLSSSGLTCAATR